MAQTWEVGCRMPCPALLPVPRVLSPMSSGDRLGDHEGGCENAPHKEGLLQKDLTPAASSGVPGLSLCTQGGAAARVHRLHVFSSA